MLARQVYGAVDQRLREPPIEGSLRVGVHIADLRTPLTETGLAIRSIGGAGMRDSPMRNAPSR